MRAREGVLRIVLVALLLYSMLSFTSAASRLHKTEQKLSLLQQQIESQRRIKAELEQKLSQEQSPEHIAQLARERLGLALPGEKLFYFSENREG